MGSFEYQKTIKLNFLWIDFYVPKYVFFNIISVFIEHSYVS